MSGVAYNPDDPLQAAFLAALGVGETGGVSNSSTLGVGGTDLSSLISAGDVDQYGFPQWQGQGNSHAAGTYQFQPSTWDSIASEFDLNFSNPQDQNAGAWYLAQQADPNLESDLQAGNYSTVQSDLQSIWPSVTGNAASPQGLAYALSGAETTASNISSAQTAANNSSGGGSGSSSSGSSGTSSIMSFLTGGFSQTALIIVGGIIVFVALWWLLSNQGIVPSPTKVAKDAVSFA